MKVTITATGNQGAGKTEFLKAATAALLAAGVIPATATVTEPENIKGKKGKLRERVTIRLPADGKVG